MQIREQLPCAVRTVAMCCEQLQCAVNSCNVLWLVNYQRNVVSCQFQLKHCELSCYEMVDCSTVTTVTHVLSSADQTRYQLLSVTRL